MSRKTHRSNYAKRTKGREEKKPGRDQNNITANPTQGRMDVQNGDKPTGLDKYRSQIISKLPGRIYDDRKLVQVYVEGYEDVSYWRGIFDKYESNDLGFEINVPPREDLAKGKKVILSMREEASSDKLLCVDSDFDYLFGNSTVQSELVNNGNFIFHTYAYATENFLCYAPSLHNVCVKATKNDTKIFDFPRFLERYSEIIYPLFIWYSFSAHQKTENLFTLAEFKTSVKLNYLEVENNGEGTLKWLERQVNKRLDSLLKKHPSAVERLKHYEDIIRTKDVDPKNTYLFIQGHTLMDNVVMVMLNAVSEQLKSISNLRISASTKTGTALRNEISNYNNSLRNVRDVLLDNESYKECFLYKKLEKDLDNFIDRLHK